MTQDTHTVDEDVDMEAVEEVLFHQELNDFVSSLQPPTQQELDIYEEKMKFLESIRLEVFGVPKPVEWEPDATIDYAYVEPYQSSYNDKN